MSGLKCIGWKGPFGNMLQATLRNKVIEDLQFLTIKGYFRFRFLVVARHSRTCFDVVSVWLIIPFDVQNIRERELVGESSREF